LQKKTLIDIFRALKRQTPLFSFDTNQSGGNEETKPLVDYPFADDVCESGNSVSPDNL